MKSRPEVLYQPKNAPQRSLAEKWASARLLLLLGPAGCGKAQPVSSTVWTPSGPQLMGNINVGDIVCTPDGGTAPVLAVFPQGQKSIFRLVFDSGDYVEGTADHLWAVRGPTGAHKVLTTAEIIESGVKTRGGRRRFSFDLPAPLHFESKSVPLDPYVLGVLLGDGGLSNDTVRFFNADLEIVQEVIRLLPRECRVTHPRDITYSIVPAVRGSINVVRAALQEIGVWGLTSDEKFIPESYLYNDEETRWGILQGLLDTDGCASSGAGIEYVSTSPALAYGVKRLVETLGGTCTVASKRTVCPYLDVQVVGHAFRCYIMLPSPERAFRLSRKKEKVHRQHSKRRWLEKIVPVRTEEAKCILVDHPAHLYITNHCIPTHNTHSALAHALRDLIDRRIRKVILCRPTVACDEDLGFFPGTLEEKLGPWLGAFHDVLGEMSWSSLDQFIDGEGGRAVEVLPVGMVRGRTVKDAVLIADEAQNLTAAQIKLLCTRVGRNGKVVLCGDPSQSDIRIRPNPLAVAASKLAMVDGVELCKFTLTDQVRDPFVTAVLTALV